MLIRPRLYSIHRLQWSFCGWLLLGICCWQACSLPLPQRSPGSNEGLVQPLDFTYLMLSTAISYREADQPRRKAYARFRIQKDQCIWFTITGPLGIEILRGMATPAGITLLNRTQKTYQVYDYPSLRALWPGPWDYRLMQALLLGELGRAYTPQEVIQGHTHEAIIQQKQGAWWLNYFVNPSLGKLEKLLAKSLQGTFTAAYQQFKPYQEGLLFKKATLSWHNDTTNDIPAITVKLAGLKPRWSQKPLKFPFSIPPGYEKK